MSPADSMRAERDELLAALKATRVELFWCAKQLAAKGLTGRPGDSVSTALDQSAKVIAKAETR